MQLHSVQKSAFLDFKEEITSEAAISPMGGRGIDVLNLLWWSICVMG